MQDWAGVPPNQNRAEYTDRILSLTRLRAFRHSESMVFTLKITSRLGLRRTDGALTGATTLTI